MRSGLYARALHVLGVCCMRLYAFGDVCTATLGVLVVAHASGCMGLYAGLYALALHVLGARCMGHVCVEGCMCFMLYALQAVRLL